MDLNKVMLIGNVGREPTYHTMGNGDELAKFTVATTRKWRDRSGGELREDTQWHNVVIFNPYLVDVCHRMIEKGTRVFVEGESKTRTYERDGQKHYINEIVVPQIKGDLWVISGGKGWDDRERNPNLPQPEPRDYPSQEDDDIPF